MNTAKKLIITDDEISQVLLLREMKRALSKKLDKIEANLKKSESELIELLECGCDVDFLLISQLMKLSRLIQNIKKKLKSD